MRIMGWEEKEKLKEREYHLNLSCVGKMQACSL